jgi:hypothetical protein
MSRRSGRSLLDEYREDVIRRAFARETLVSIGARYGTSYTNVYRWLAKKTDVYKTLVKCVLIECDETFLFKGTRLACSRLHIKRYCARGGPGEYLPCSLPECDELVLVPNRDSGKLWWCDKSRVGRRHADIHYKRVETGFYARLLSNYQQCVGRTITGERCSEHICIDEHHTVFDTKGSDKSSPMIHLCSTHHQAIHRGMAVYKDGEYRWVVGEILEGLKSKHPVLVENI